MIGRHELKYYINYIDYTALRTRLRLLAIPDKNADDDGGYQIRSLYFDNYSDKAVMEKLSGQSRREKFRIRYYNNDLSFMRLEKKSKTNQLVYKENAHITAEQCKQLLAKDYKFLISSDNPLLTELYTKIRYQNLRPKNIVEYRREVYTYKAGNVRVTLDSSIKTSNSVRDFLDSKQMLILAANAIILEIKYDGFLPDVIRDLVQIDCRNQTEFSKYVVARLV